MSKSLSSSQVKERRIVDYDFRRPQRLSKDQLKTIRAVYEVFGEVFTNSIRAQIGAPIEVRIDDIKQITYQEFTSSLPNPTCLGVVGMDPWRGASLIEVDNGIILAIIDRLLGGGGEIKESPKRELTEIELEISRGILDGMVEALRAAWKDIEELNPKLIDVMVNPERVQLIQPHEIVIVAIIGMKIGKLEGILRHGIPYNLIDPIAERLISQYRYHSDQRVGDAEILERLREGIQEVPVRVVVELGRARISMADILGLQIGDVVKLTTKVNDDLVLKVYDQEKFMCRPGVVGRKMAVQITQIGRKE